MAPKLTDRGHGRLMAKNARAGKSSKAKATKMAKDCKYIIDSLKTKQLIKVVERLIKATLKRTYSMFFEIIKSMEGFVARYVVVRTPKHV